MSTSTIGTVMDALVDDLSGLSSLVGVNVFSGPVSYEEAGLECIALGDVSLTDSALAMGGTRLEEYTIDGELRIAASWQGTTEATIRASRDRALDLFAAIETHVNDTYTGAFPKVEVTAGTLTPEFNTEGRFTWLSFTLTVQATKNP